MTLGLEQSSFLWRPGHPDRERFLILIESRDIDMQQELWIDKGTFRARVTEMTRTKPSELRLLGTIRSRGYVGPLE
jgi:hypothetical protein